MNFSNRLQKLRLLILPAVILAAVLPFLLIKNRVSTDITVLLPDDKWIAAHMDFLQNSQIGSISAISIQSENRKEAEKIPEFAEKFSNSIKNAPSVKEVFFRISPQMLTETAAFLCPRAPQIMNSDDLTSLQGKIAPEQVKNLLKKHYENLLRPGGLFQQKLVASDPLNLHQIILKKIEKIGKDSGFKFILHENGLWSEDGKHFLMLIYTDIPVTDADKGEKYIAMLEESLDQSLPASGYSYTIMSGHKHSIENRRLLKRDITVTLTVAAIGFFLLFALFFKDWRAVFVFLIPILGMLCAIGLTWLFFNEPSAIILGLGATVIGIALDYGIHVFVSVKRSEDSLRSIKTITRPLIFSAFTTLGVFWAFFFSGTPGYHQLAFASTCGIAVSLLLSLACLPLIITANGNKGVRCQGSDVRREDLRILNCSFPSFSMSSAKKVITIWILAVSVSIFLIFTIGFESDIRKMDGSGETLQKEKDEFQKIWGTNAQAAITVTDSDIESAMQKQDTIAKFANKNQIHNFQSLSIIWPSLKTRKKNLQSWKDFWQDEILDQFKNNLIKYGKPYGFSDSAFDPFFSNIDKQTPDDNFMTTKGFALFSRKFINRKNDKVRVNAFFSDDQESVNRLKEFTSKISDCDVISPRHFGFYISNKILDDAVHIAIIALILVVVLAGLCLRKVSATLLALIPVLSSALSIIPLYAACGWKINAIALVAMIVVTGLAIDYGIFAVTALKNNDQEFAKNAFTALTISMLSTIIGSGALLWASHPALNTVGIVLSTGVLSGYFSAIFIVPAIGSITRELRNIKI